jgi:hypothetical protein
MRGERAGPGQQAFDKNANIVNNRASTSDGPPGTWTTSVVG